MILVGIIDTSFYLNLVKWYMWWTDSDTHEFICRPSRQH